jgi:hypothetical protein
MISAMRGLMVLLLLGQTMTATAGAMAERDVPAPLKPWVGWVLHGEQANLCPPVQDDASRRLCRWPSQLKLRLDADGGRFDLSAKLDAPGWLVLPGSAQYWPLDVRADGREAAVLWSNDAPSLFLPAGTVAVSGRFAWNALPEALPLPPDAGLVALQVDDREVQHPARDAQGRLWLGRAAIEPQAQGDHLDLRVFRQIDDDLPIRLTTRLQIEAGGNVREELIGPVLPAGFVPLSLDGDLPARLEADGRVRVQLRPGLWTLSLVARASGPTNKLGSPKLPAPWPQQEVWSFQAHPDLRAVEVSGASAIDPRQTAMPQEWHQLPAYLLEAGTELALDEKQRGLASTQADELHLERQLWLDFDGDGFSLQDRLSGSLASRWRLETTAPIVPGRVDVDGQPQLITQSADKPGVEVRRSQLNLLADARVDEDLRRLPVSGWNVDLQSVTTTLQLPPGWRLLAAPGADAAPDSWLTQWTLLDLFLVLIAAIAALRLFGPATGALTLLTLILIWHQGGAPRYAWLNLIAAIALLQALPDAYREGRLQAFLDRYRWISVIALVLIAIPFALQQARSALHPQLERVPGWGFGVAVPTQAEAPPPEADAVAPAAAPMVMAEMAEDSAQVLSAPSRMVRKIGSKMEAHYGGAGGGLNQQSIQQLDPKALTQTGAGVPQWAWRSARLSWSGPVTSEQTFRLWLQPPWLTRLLNVAAIALIAVLLLRWLQPPTDRRFRLAWRPPAASAGLLLVALAAALAPPPLRAQPEAVIVPEPPPQTLLDQLRERLLAPPDCMPGCAQLPQMKVSIDGRDQLLLRLMIDAQVETAVPLPLPQLAGAEQGGVWQPQSALLDGAPADVRREPDGSLWLRAPAGRHQLVLAGSLSGLTQIQLPLPLPPRRVEMDVRGWRAGGLSADGRPGAVLELLRETVETAPAAETGTRQALPPFLVVTRTLSLGTNWDLSASVERIGSSAAAMVAGIPQIGGEVVTGEGVRVENGKVMVSFAPGQTTAGWTSRLAPSAKLDLKAASEPDLFETWRFDISPLWHVEFDGLPPIQRQENGYLLPVFRPWPGETLQLRVSKPTALTGQTLTLDRAQLSLQPGKRVGDLQLTLALRASQGGQHIVSLPDGMEVQNLRINGQPQPARTENGKLILALQPGTQLIELGLRQNRGVGFRVKTPALALGLPGVNTHLAIDLPADRWVLWTSGPRLGPAVLFWSVLAVLLLIAMGLGQVPLTPLRSRHWMLLMVGLSQLPVWGAGVVVAWLMVLGWRGRMEPSNGSESRFNLIQVLIAGLSFAALALLFGAVAQGLLGAPDMQISGNESSGNSLRWFQDRHDGTLPQAAAISVSIWFYRGLMLLWALWLANSLLAWLRWGWEQYSHGALWRRKPPAPTPTPQETPPP